MNALAQVKTPVLAVALVLVWCVPQAWADEKLSLEVAAKLNRRIDVEKGIDPNTPLRDALEFLGSEKFGSVPIVNNTASFEEFGLRDVETQPVRLPKLTNVKIGDVLRILLGQLAVPATYWIRSNYVEIVPEARVRAHLGISQEETLPPLLYAKFNNQPLETVLQEIADESGLTIVLDPKVGEKSTTSVKASFKNVTVPTAVRLLADMADLKSVTIDNVLYVTTKANAESLQAEQEKRKQKKPQPDSKKEDRPLKPKDGPLGGAK